MSTSFLKSKKVVFFGMQTEVANQTNFTSRQAEALREFTSDSVGLLMFNQILTSLFYTWHTWHRGHHHLRLQICECASKLIIKSIKKIYQIQYLSLQSSSTSHFKSKLSPSFSLMSCPSDLKDFNECYSRSKNFTLVLSGGLSYGNFCFHSQMGTTLTLMKWILNKPNDPCFELLGHPDSIFYT